MIKKVVLLCIAVMCTLAAQAQITCRLIGKVNDRPQSKTLILLQLDEDERFDGIRIPIEDGRFEYTLNCDVTEIYRLVFDDEIRDGSWYATNFCADNGTVEFVLNPMEVAEKNSITGGDENARMKSYTAYRYELDSLYLMPLYEQAQATPFTERLTTQAAAIMTGIENSKNAHTKDSLMQLLRQLKDEDRYLNDKARALEGEMMAAYDRAKSMAWAYQTEHPSLFGYSEVVAELMRYNSDYRAKRQPIDEYEKFLEQTYHPLYPKHPYTAKSKELIESLKTVRVGGKFIDFSAPDLNGKMHTLSESITGKIAIIDLWASWCAPCRKNSISLIPIWDEYASADFTIIGVAGENRDDKAMRKAIVQDGYKWLNLIELDKKAGIWDKCGSSNDTGKIFMVDRDGIILAINPNASQIQAILKEKLKR